MKKYRKEKYRKAGVILTSFLLVICILPIAALSAMGAQDEDTDSNSIPSSESVSISESVPATVAKSELNPTSDVAISQPEPIEQQEEPPVQVQPPMQVQPPQNATEEEQEDPLAENAPQQLFTIAKKGEETIRTDALFTLVLQAPDMQGQAITLTLPENITYVPQENSTAVLNEQEKTMIIPVDKTDWQCELNFFAPSQPVEAVFTASAPKSIPQEITVKTYPSLQPRYGYRYEKVWKPGPHGVAGIPECPPIEVRANGMKFSGLYLNGTKTVYRKGAWVYIREKGSSFRNIYSANIIEGEWGRYGKYEGLIRSNGMYNIPIKPSTTYEVYISMNSFYTPEPPYKDIPSTQSETFEFTTLNIGGFHAPTVEKKKNTANIHMGWYTNGGKTEVKDYAQKMYFKREQDSKWNAVEWVPTSIEDWESIEPSRGTTMVQVNDLEPDTTYQYKFSMLRMKQKVESPIYSFKTDPLFLFKTNPDGSNVMGAENITTNSARLYADWQIYPNKAMDGHGLYKIKDTSDETYVSKRVEEGFKAPPDNPMGDGRSYILFDGLASNTTYTSKMQGSIWVNINETKRYPTTEMNFTTLPVVKFELNQESTSNSAIIKGTTPGNAAIKQYKYRYNKVGDTNVLGSGTVTPTTGQDFMFEITGLEENLKYEIYIQAENESGWSEETKGNFYTKKVPIVETGVAMGRPDTWQASINFKVKNAFDVEGFWVRCSDKKMTKEELFPSGTNIDTLPEGVRSATNVNPNNIEMTGEGSVGAYINFMKTNTTYYVIGIMRVGGEYYTSQDVLVFTSQLEQNTPPKVKEVTATHATVYGTYEGTGKIIETKYSFRKNIAGSEQIKVQNGLVAENGTYSRRLPLDGTELEPNTSYSVFVSLKNEAKAKPIIKKNSVNFITKPRIDNFKLETLDSSTIEVTADIPGDRPAKSAVITYSKNEDMSEATTIELTSPHESITTNKIQHSITGLARGRYYVKMEITGTSGTADVPQQEAYVPKKYPINIANVEDGYAKAYVGEEEVTQAYPEDIVTIKTVPEITCSLKNLTVTQGDTNIPLTGSDSEFTFTMPDGAVNVTPAFGEARGMLNITIPTNMLFATTSETGQDIIAPKYTIQNNSAQYGVEVILDEFTNTGGTPPRLLEIDDTPPSTKEYAAKLVLSSAVGTNPMQVVKNGLPLGDRQNIVLGNLEPATGKMKIKLGGIYYGDNSQEEKSNYYMVLKFRPIWQP